MVIYITKNKIDGKKYIGKDSKNDNNYLGSGVYLKRAIKKHGTKNFTKEVIEYCETYEELNEREKYWISFFNATKSIEYYNISDGGDGGYRLSGYSDKQLKEYKNKISKTSKGRKHTEEAKRKISKARKGIIFSEETKKKISKSVKKLWENKEYKENQINKRTGAKTGRPSEETIKKISESTKGKNKGNIPWNKGIHYSLSKDSLEKMREKISGVNSYGYGKKWMNKGDKNVYVNKEDIEKFIEKGYKLGMIKKNKK
jgi:group I intron endonuclease